MKFFPPLHTHPEYDYYPQYRYTQNMLNCVYRWLKSNTENLHPEQREENMEEENEVLSEEVERN